jgi:hypothetical protein
MKGFDDLLWKKLSSLIMLLGWISLSVTSLMIWSVHLDFLASMLVTGNCK